MASEVRTRTRNIDLTQPTAIDPAQTLDLGPMRAAALEFQTANIAKNAQTKKENAARKELQRLMACAEINTLGFVGVDDVLMEAVISRPETVVINMALLREIVDDDIFMKLVKSTMTAVKEQCGSNTLARVSDIKVGDDKVSLKKAD